MDTQSKLNLRKTFTWGPGRHINALHIFSLDRVSIGIYFVTLRQAVLPEFSFAKLIFAQIFGHLSP